VDYAGFLKAVERDQIPPVTLLHGPEPFLLEEAAARVTRAMFPEGVDVTLVRETFDARDTDADAIVRSALVLPWGAARRLVMATAVEGLGAKQGEPLAAYVRSPNPSTVLLLLAGQSLSASHWLTQAVPASGHVSVPVPAGRQLSAWLRARSRTDGLEVAEDAADLLVELVGNDLARLRGEVDKAALAGGPANRRVGVAEVRAVVGEHRLRNIFELTGAVAAGDTAAALSLLELLHNAGEDPLGLLAMLGREVRALWQAAEGLRQGRREDEIVRLLRRPPAAAKAVIERARAMDPGGPGRLLERCWEVERRLKLSAPARPELSLLVADLCRG
jgi:DNA polymerase-3 subunit delta